MLPKCKSQVRQSPNFRSCRNKHTMYQTNYSNTSLFNCIPSIIISRKRYLTLGNTVSEQLVAGSSVVLWPGYKNEQHWFTTQNPSIKIAELTLKSQCKDSQQTETKTSHVSNSIFGGMAHNCNCEVLSDDVTNSIKTSTKWPLLVEHISW